MQAHRPGEILVVDGSSQFLTLAATTLHRRGHAVRICAYAGEAREHLERHVFDAVLTSAKLPDGSGAELCVWIKSHEDLQGVPVAMLLDAHEIKDPDDPIAEIMRDYVPGAPSLGGPLAPDDFIVRPVRAEEFAVRVAGLLKLRRYRDEIGNALSAMLSLAEGIEEQDARSRGHCRRLSTLAVLLGSCLRCDDYELLTLERAGYLHDIGKAAIPGALLEKSQPLTPREMEIVKGHTIIGEKLCSGVVALQAVLPIIRHHHEKGDGTGYPDGLRGAQIPKLAALFSVVDVYDSLRTWRPYRPPLTQWQAVEVMRGEVANGWWNRDFFDVFVNNVLPVAKDHLQHAGVAWPETQ